MDNIIAESFRRAKQDILNLQSQINIIKQEIQEINRTLQSQINQTKPQEIQTLQTQNQTIRQTEEPFSTGNKGVSTGNEGVQTDRQTIRQTDNTLQEVRLNNLISPQIPKNKTIDRLEEISKALNSLDDLKRELRSLIKKLTPQEMLIFSTIYQLEETQGSASYPSLSKSTGLSESSIRDHVKNLIKKGIPVDKTKHQNKKITLSISQNLKKIASLDTILHLRTL